MTSFTQSNSEKWFHAVLAVSFVITGTASIVAVWYGQLLFIYPTATALMATLVAALFSPAAANYLSFHFLSDLQSAYEVKLNDDRPLVILLFLLISTAEAVYLLSGFTDLYFLLLLAFIGVFSVLVLRGTWQLPLFALFLLAVLFRANLWFSAPIYSKDPRLHTAIVGYMIETGQLIPDSVSYYRSYPVADIFGKIASLILSVTPKQAYFFVITLPAVLAAFIAFPAIRRVLKYRYDEAAAAAVALVLFSAFHLTESAGPKPQTLSTAYLVVLLLLMTVEIRYRQALSTLFFLILVKTHLLAPLIAIALLGAYFVAGCLLPRFLSQFKFDRRHGQPYVLAIALAIAALQQYHFVGHFRLQFYRLLRPFRQGGGAASFVSSAGELTTTDVLMQLNPLFLQAGTLLIIAFLAIIVGFLFLRNILSIHEDDVEWDWILTGILLFTGLSAGFFGSSVLRRATAVVTILVAPMVAFALTKLIQDRKIILTGVFVVILLSGTYLGFAHPTVVLSERNNGFKPTLNAAEVESMSFAQDFDEDPYSLSYYTRSAYLHKVRNGNLESDINLYKHHRSATKRTLVEYCKEFPKTPFVYRSFYKSHANMTLPRQADVIYSTSGIRILASCNTTSK
jgi:hypothetical protein